MIPNFAVRTYPESEPSAKETTLETRVAKGREYLLRHRTAGVEPLFRGTKFATEAWGVIFYADARHGRWFKTEAEARELFAKWTSPETR